MDKWRTLQNSVVRSVSLDSGSGKSSNSRSNSSFGSKFASIVNMVTGTQPTKRPTKYEKFHTLSLDVGEHVRLRIHNERRKEIFSAVVGENAPPGTEVEVQKKEEVLIVFWVEYAQLTITHLINADCHQYDINWELIDGVAGPLQDSIHLINSHWYGGATTHHHTWPISSQHRLAPFVCCDSRYEPTGYGGIQEPYWISSRGAAIYVDPQVPLFVSVNEDENQLLTLVSKYERPYRNLFEHKLYLKYTVYHGPDIRTTYDLVKSEHFACCDSQPCEDLFKEPLWSTSPFLGSTLNEENLIGYVKDIREQGFEPNYLVIADDWTSAYGDLTFNPDRFPEPKSVMETIKRKGFKLMAWVHPFASPRSKAFFEGTSTWVKSSIVEGVTTWEHGPAKLLDITSDEARMWFKKRMKDLKLEFDFDTFMFDFGQVNYLPPLFATNEPISNPDNFSRQFIDLAYDMSSQDKDALVKVGMGTQKIPLMISLEDRAVDWGWHNGLKSIIPAVLSAGLMGYPFILPGVVGGRSGTDKPGTELYLRWVAAVVLMPGMMFSLPPWEYGDEAVKMVIALLDIRRRYTEYMLQLAEEAVDSGAPIIRPLWWANPKDNITMTIDTQFLLGDDVMVAPILEKGMSNRAIYLPSGLWRDELRGKTIPGPKWLYSYRAKLGELPHFHKLPDVLEELDEEDGVEYE